MITVMIMIILVIGTMIRLLCWINRCRHRNITYIRNRNRNRNKNKWRNIDKEERMKSSRRLLLNMLNVCIKCQYSCILMLRNNSNRCRYNAKNVYKTKINNIHIAKYKHIYNNKIASLTHYYVYKYKFKHNN